MSLYVGPGGTERLGDILRAEFQATWTAARFATAYAKMSGINHVYDILATFASTDGRTLRATIGIDQHGTSYEALAALLTLFAPHGHELFVCHNPRIKGSIASPTFHPKLWLFDDGAQAKLLVGSGNLTQGGLYTNYEVGTVQDLDLHAPLDRHVFDGAIRMLDRWTNLSFRDVKRLDQQLLDDLFNANLVLSEDEIRRASRTSARARVLSGGRTETTSIGGAVFQGEDFQAPPTLRARAPRNQPPAAAPLGAGGTTRRPAATAPVAPVVPQNLVFYTHLSQTEKTEIYLAQAPLRDDPAFFGLPFTGRTEPRRAGNPPQPQASPWPLSDVTVYDATGVADSCLELPTKMWQYMEGANANKDVRIYLSAKLQSFIVNGSVCVIARDPRPGIDYAISIYAPGHPDFARYDAKCVTSLPNSPRRYGWS
ncbi:MAG: phospholipase D family protein [Gemmatimonadota bacterium]|nr:phospholipase D family protein [Gemmatimonadota bacterium]